MSSDQKFTTFTAMDRLKTFRRITNIWSYRVTYIQATGITNLNL